MNSFLWDCNRSATKLDELEVVLNRSRRGRILVLAHNNPDPDSIAGAAAFQLLLKKKFGQASVIGYGGVVTRAENKAMIHRLRIRMTRLRTIDRAKYGKIALIDAQPGASNNLLGGRSPAPMIVIDHHPLRKASHKAAFHDIRPGFGATSTILTEYLIAAGIPPTRSVANALVYGIKTDTNSLMRGASEFDLKALQYLSQFTNPRVLGWIEKPALPVEHFVEYHRGLSRTTIYRDVAICYMGKIGSESIIPRLADDLLRIDGVSWSLCMGEIQGLIILSLRSTSKTYRAGTIIRKLVGKAGFAGGHRELAGGQIPLEGMDDLQKEELPKKLTNRFLKLIDRDGVNPKPLVETAA
jgi:nanoRNase/pAp phosphatase (c-di-AMP/oligoRNAs hydrolase)